MNSFEAVPLIITDLMSNHAKNTPVKTALIFEEHRYSWEELNRRINKVANALIQNGIRKGDKVSVFLPNMRQNIEIMFGIIKAGGILVPLATMIESDTLLHMIKDSDSKMIFYSEDNIDLINSIRERLTFYNDDMVKVERKGFGTYEQFIENASSEDPGVELQYEDDCIILYSSGTTGTPKGILHTHYSRFMFATRLATGDGLDKNAVTLLTTPLYTNSTWATMLPTLTYGGTIIIMEKFKPERFLEISQKEKPTHALMVPTQYYLILNYSSLNKYDTTSYENLMSVSAPLHKQIKLEIINTFNCKFTELYGLTEGIGTSLSPEDVLKKPDSVGTSSLGEDIRIINEEGTELPANEPGEIVGRGSTVMKEYYKLPEKTQEVMWIDQKGKKYLKTGDMGKLDQDGYLYILGRKKDMIISGGINIYAADIENVFVTHPDVAECAVIGIPHEKWGEIPLALVLLKQDSIILKSYLKDWINERVNKYQRVADVEIVDSFPRNSLGKILKKELRK